MGISPERAARDQADQVYYVPESMTYREWEKKCKNVASEAEESKRKYKYSDTVVSTEVEGLDYRHKFDDFKEIEKVKRRICSEARKMLNHRSGTKYEDLAFIDSKTGKFVVRTDYDVEKEVLPSKAMIKWYNRHEEGTIISVHNHPDSYMPSLTDLKTAREKKYKYGLIACHNGKIIKYSIKGSYNSDYVDTLLDNANVALYNENEKELNKN